MSAPPVRRIAPAGAALTATKGDHRGGGREARGRTSRPLQKPRCRSCRRRGRGGRAWPWRRGHGWWRPAPDGGRLVVAAPAVRSTLLQARGERLGERRRRCRPCLAPCCGGAQRHHARLWRDGGRRGRGDRAQRHELLGGISSFGGPIHRSSPRGLGKGHRWRGQHSFPLLQVRRGERRGPGRPVEEAPRSPASAVILRPCLCHQGEEECRFGRRRAMSLLPVRVAATRGPRRRSPSAPQSTDGSIRMPQEGTRAVTVGAERRCATAEEPKHRLHPSNSAFTNLAAAKPEPNRGDCNDLQDHTTRWWRALFLLHNHGAQKESMRRA